MAAAGREASVWGEQLNLLKCKTSPLFLGGAWLPGCLGLFWRTAFTVKYIFCYFNLPLGTWSMCLNEAWRHLFQAVEEATGLNPAQYPQFFFFWICLLQVLVNLKTLKAKLVPLSFASYLQCFQEECSSNMLVCTSFKLTYINLGFFSFFSEITILYWC